MQINATTYPWTSGKEERKRQVYLEKIGDCVIFMLSLTKYRLTFARLSHASLNESPTLTPMLFIEMTVQLKGSKKRMISN